MLRTLLLAFSLVVKKDNIALYFIFEKIEKNSKSRFSIIYGLYCSVAIFATKVVILLLLLNSFALTLLWNDFTCSKNSKNSAEQYRPNYKIITLR